MNTKLLYSVCLIFILSSCGGVDTRKRAEVLDTSIQNYITALRWAQYTDAHSYHVKKDGSTPKLDLSDLEDIRITGYEIHERSVNEELNEARITGELNYYNTSYGTLKKTSFSQLWWFEEKSNRWLLESEFPVFK